MRISHQVRALTFLSFILLTFHCANGSTMQISSIPLLANDLVYDPVSQRIYASVSSDAGAEYGNTVTVINPLTRKIEDSVFVGSEPNRLAVTDDGQSLYVGLDGAGAVRRLDIPTRTAAL